MSSSIRESMTKALAKGGLVTTKPHGYPEAFEICLGDGGASISVKALSPEEIGKRFQDLEVFFLEMRRKVRELTKSGDWNIRYASQISCMNLPFLHNSSDLTILIDPMLPYRNPVQSLAGGETVSLFLIPSQVYYAKSKDKALAIANVQRKPHGAPSHKARSNSTDNLVTGNKGSHPDGVGRPQYSSVDDSADQLGPTTT